MEFKQMMIDFLSKTLGKSNDAVTELLFKKSDDGQLTDEINAEAPAQLETLISEHLASTGTDAEKKAYDKGHKEGKFQALNQAEEKLRKDYGVEGANILEIVQSAVAKTAQASTSDDKVLTHPLYIKLKSESETQLQTVMAESEAKVKEVEGRVEKQTRFSENLPKIDAALAELGVVMPKNAAAAATLRKAFMAEFADFDFDAQETGTYLKKADGSLQKDKFGHPVTLEAFTKERATNWFDVEKQPGRQAPGNDPGGQPPAKWTAANVPKSAAEFETAYYSISDPAERTALTVAYQEAAKGAG